MTKILLTRHGHVEGIVPERFRGRAELALTKKGVAEAEALAARIARAWKPAVVYTSALQRCVVTGTIIANLCGAKAIPLGCYVKIVGMLPPDKEHADKVEYDAEGHRVVSVRKSNT